MLNESVLAKLKTQLKEHAPEYDAIINLAKPPQPLTADLTDGEALFEEYEKVRRYHLQSSILMVHLAACQMTSPDAYILFNSRLSAYNYELIGKNKFFTQRP